MSPNKSRQHSSVPGKARHSRGNTAGQSEEPKATASAGPRADTTSERRTPDDRPHSEPTQGDAGQPATSNETTPPRVTGGRAARTRSHRTSDEEESAALDDFDLGFVSYRSDRNAFLRDPAQGPAHSTDDVAEELAEQFLSSATSDEDRDDARKQEPSIEEEGGPYVPSTSSEELGGDPDLSNPEEAEVAPFPTTQSEH